MKDFTVTVHAGAQQQFGGLGLHVGSSVDYKNRRTPIMDESGPGPYGNVAIEVRKEIAKLLFGPGKFNWVRIWNVCPEQMKDLKEAGVSNFMLTGTGTLDNQPLAEKMAEQTLDVIKQGYPIKAVSYANKANQVWGVACRRPLEGKQRGLPEGLKMLRAELDKKGLQAIPIVAPETCEWSPYREHGGGHDYKDKNPDKPTNGFVDGDNLRYMRAIADDPESLKALGVFSTQTYGQGRHPGRASVRRPSRQALLGDHVLAERQGQGSVLRPCHRRCNSERSQSRGQRLVLLAAELFLESVEEEHEIGG